MISLDNSDDTYEKRPTTGLEGVQDWYTDFDRWITKFSKYVHRSSVNKVEETIKKTTIIEKHKNGSVNQEYAETLLPLEELYVEGSFVHSKSTRTFGPRRLENLKKYINSDIINDELMFFDYILFQLVMGNEKCFQYIKSKL